MLKQNSRHISDIFERFFFYKNIVILIKAALKFIQKGSIDHKSASIQVSGTDTKPLPEPMLTKLNKPKMWLLGHNESSKPCLCGLCSRMCKSRKSHAY